MRLNQNDTVFCKDSMTLKLQPFTVVRVTDRQAILDSEVKLTRELENGKFELIPRGSISTCTYIPYSEELANEYRSQNEVTESVGEKAKSWYNTFNAEKFFGHTNFALLVTFVFVMVQAIHTSHAFYELTDSLSSKQRWVFSTVGAVFSDFLLLWFIVRGARFKSWIVMIFMIQFNMVSYELTKGFSTYEGHDYFKLVACVFVPLMLHLTASEMKKEIKSRKNTTPWYKKLF